MGHMNERDEICGDNVKPLGPEGRSAALGRAVERAFLLAHATAENGDCRDWCCCCGGCGYSVEKVQRANLHA